MGAVRFVVAVVVATSLVGGAFAAPVTIAFTGTVSQTPNLDPTDPFGGTITTGTPFAGSYTFDPAAADAVAADPQTGSYRSVGAPYSLHVEFGSPGVFGISFGEIAIGIGNDYAGADFYTFIAPLAAPDLDLTASLVMIDSDASVFDSDALPAGAPALDEFDTRQFSLIGSLAGSDGNTVQIEILGSLDTLACTAGCSVPEPGSLSLVAAGLAALLARRRSPSRPARPAPRTIETEERS